MRSRTAVALAFVLLLSAGCSGNLGRGIPECGPEPRTPTIVQIQSVPGASYVPCVATVVAGWEVNPVEPSSGGAVFNLDSDRLGDRFLTVSTTETCDLAAAEPSTSDEGPIERYKAVEADFDLRIAVVPEGPVEETSQAARSIVVDTFGMVIEDRYVDARVDKSEGPTAERIAAAASEGGHVISISIRDAEEGTVSLLLAGAKLEMAHLTVQQALDMIEEVTDEPSYRGSWFYVFDGGCTEYRFDAEGPGVERVAADVQRALSFIDAEAIKQMARDAGYDLP